MPETDQGLNLADYWQILKKRKLIALLAFFLTVSATYLFTRFTTPVYRASTTIELKEKSQNVQALGGLAGSWTMDINTELRKIKSYPVLKEVAQNLGSINEETSKEDEEKILSKFRINISAVEITGTSLIKISVNDPDPEETIKLANIVAGVYIDNSIEERNIRGRKTREFIEEQLQIVGEELEKKEDEARKFEATGGIRARVSAIGGNITKLTVKYSQLLTKYSHKHPEVIRVKNEINDLKKRMGKLTSDELKYIRIMRDFNVNEGLYGMLNRRLREALITEADKVIPAVIVDPARKADLIKPNKRLNMMMGVIVGLLFAVIMVIVKENLDTSLRTSRDVESYLKLPTLAEIPHVREQKKDGFNFPFLLTHQNGKSAYMEAYNILGANIASFDHKRKHQVILFTSVMPREGKSEVVANYGIVESQTGRKTVLLDTDFRQAAQHKLFKVSRKPGIIDAITENLNWKTVIQKPDIADFELNKENMMEKGEKIDLQNLWILSCGHLPSYPVRFLNSEGFGNLITELKKEFDTILLDSPPLYYFADPTILLSKVDGVILVHKPGSSSRDDIMKAKSQLSSGDSKLLGVVLNDVKGKRRGRYYYRYYSRHKST